MPTLAAGEVLEACLRALESQTVDEFEVVVIDNSGTGRAQASHPEDFSHVRVIANPRNVGFGAAVNQAFRASTAPDRATLNDDAAADPLWLETLAGCKLALQPSREVPGSLDFFMWYDFPPGTQRMYSPSHIWLMLFQRIKSIAL